MFLKSCRSKQDVGPVRRRTDVGTDVGRGKEENRRRSTRTDLVKVLLEELVLPWKTGVDNVLTKSEDLVLVEELPGNDRWSMCAQGPGTTSGNMRRVAKSATHLCL